MGKGLIITILITLVLILSAGIGYYIWDNSESVIRDRIQNSYYNELSYETCVLNTYRGFPSQDNCIRALKCVSERISQLVRVDELKQLNKKVKAKESLEGPLSTYSNSAYPSCFNQFGFNETLR